MQDHFCVELKTFGWLYGWAQMVLCAMMIGAMWKVKNYGVIVILCKCFDTQEEKTNELNFEQKLFLLQSSC